MNSHLLNSVILLYTFTHLFSIKISLFRDFYKKELNSLTRPLSLFICQKNFNEGAEIFEQCVNWHIISDGDFQNNSAQNLE